MFSEMVTKEVLFSLNRALSCTGDSRVAVHTKRQSGHSTTVGSPFSRNA
jgi:hypothetical protein